MLIGEVRCARPFLISLHIGQWCRYDCSVMHILKPKRKCSAIFGVRFWLYFNNRNLSEKKHFLPLHQACFLMNVMKTYTSTPWRILIRLLKFWISCLSIYLELIFVLVNINWLLELKYQYYKQIYRKRYIILNPSDTSRFRLPVGTASTYFLNLVIHTCCGLTLAKLMIGPLHVITIVHEIICLVLWRRADLIMSSSCLHCEGTVLSVHHWDRHELTLAFTTTRVTPHHY